MQHSSRRRCLYSPRVWPYYHLANCRAIERASHEQASAPAPFVVEDGGIGDGPQPARLLDLCCCRHTGWCAHSSLREATAGSLCPQGLSKQLPPRWESPTGQSFLLLLHMRTRGTPRFVLGQAGRYAPAGQGLSEARRAGGWAPSRPRAVPVLWRAFLACCLPSPLLTTTLHPREDAPAPMPFPVFISYHQQIAKASRVIWSHQAVRIVSPYKFVCLLLQASSALLFATPTCCIQP